MTYSRFISLVPSIMSKTKTRVRKGNVINGIINLDKPLGFSSNKALQKLKYLLKAQKAGHTGALDPLATGVLPLCFGHATKISGFLLDADKRYTATLSLGKTTNTGDLEGEFTNERPIPALNEEMLEACLAKFRGQQQQVPPMYSALKYQGQPLYKLARKGEKIEIKPRDIFIYELNLLSFSACEVVIDVLCSKGTYIRSLAQDIGEALGCGAHLSALRRTQAGPFTLENAHRIEDISQSIEEGGIEQALSTYLIGSDKALMHYPEIALSASQSEDLLFGRKVQLDLAQAKSCLKLAQGLAMELTTSENKENKFRIYSHENAFLGLGDILAIKGDGSDMPTLYLYPKRIFSS